MKRFDTVLYWTAVIVVGLLLGLPVLLFIFVLRILLGSA